jgi:hypothetical protein
MSVAGNISKKGKGLPWNPAERLALCKSAHVTLFDPVRGAGMKTTELARRLKAEFLRQALDCAASNSAVDCGDKDSRLLLRRTTEACFKSFATIKAACSQWGAVLGQVDDLRLTGNPSIAETTLFCTGLYNKRETLANFKAVF